VCQCAVCVCVCVCVCGLCGVVFIDVDGVVVGGKWVISARGQS
jgi:hypothetical protein